MQGLIVIGGGEHARVVIDAARSQHWNVLGFVDPYICEETAIRLNVPRLGGDDSLTQSKYSDASFVLGVAGIGVTVQRRLIVERIDVDRARWASVIHASATVSSTALIEPGGVVLGGAVINTGAHVGAHSIVNSAAVVEHDVRLGEFVHVGPGSALGGGTTVGQESYLGIGCRIRDHIALGNRTFVGMGAVVTKSFSDNARLVGVPARNLLAIPPRASQKLK